MSRGLVLSLFPGIGMFDRAFEEEGFCVVRGPDLLWGGDIHEFHPPAGKFDGVIGGPPCPAHSSAANIARNAAGKTVKPDLIPQFARVVLEANPSWWVMENVPSAPQPFPSCERLDLNNRWVGGTQRRKRVFYSNVKLSVPGNALEAIDLHPTASTAQWVEGRQYGATTRPWFEKFRMWQGLEDDFELPGFTVRQAVQAVVNGVPLPMGRAIARAVVKALEAQ